MLACLVLYGSRCVADDTTTHAHRRDELATMANRVLRMRQALYDALIECGAPGDWKHILNQRGLFTYSGLTGGHSLPCACWTIVDVTHTCTCSESSGSAGDKPPCVHAVDGAHEHVRCDASQRDEACSRHPRRCLCACWASFRLLRLLIDIGMPTVEVDG